ncbi:MULTISPECIES: 2OG-Fe(II) oxygenase [unclassified Ruegeria]|uniref:HalD/BesD family halogenase n=1 Tax=unclassified Ruegeria TaxID=2625375 RepID=UPI001487C85A|nr:MULTISPECIES: 2OG-Fe(II) oxygenase [unclassified Ruegeria]NOD47662.1 2OG-Fe(II) oxygenase [Ruegeria sp. HKCCD5849]NOD52675.1 2OG-Fe(II) oxygenase [Ruegeria sp. HKCCD5851]NOD66094.1 2OG-Fe(II) oxygenase [Ruegeria sp. HKCCD7303]NOE35747.1 2OG-Fe(II) oxygenase [Ruegeria sp. HKCCD7318]
MKHLLDLEKYPLHRPDSREYEKLVKKCRADLASDGMFNLPGFFKPGIAQQAADAAKPALDTVSFRHARKHNVYFKDDMPGIDDAHPAMVKSQTVNHTLCADQLEGNPVIDVYEWQPFADFLAATMGKEKLYQMDDPMARVNVQATRDGEGLNWHFDRSEFTTTILLQAPEVGGELEYRKDLRTPDDQNYEGVVAVLAGKDPEVKRIMPLPGALNVFRGVNTPHRVVPVQGDTERVIAIFSFYETPGVYFSAEEQIGFYGRSVS